MSDSASDIRDDEVQYYAVCRKYKETPVGLYGIHYDWIMKKYTENYEGSFNEYELENAIKRLEIDLINYKDAISKIQDKTKDKIARIHLLKEQLKKLKK